MILLCFQHYQFYSSCIQTKIEKQLLYEHIRNINNILETLDKQRDTQYKKFKDTVSNSNEHDQDLDLDRCRLFINKIKDHRHEKIKEKHIEKFKRLYFKHYGYQHNLNRWTNNSNNINQNTLSRQPNVPSSISRTSTTASNPTTISATPMAPTPSSSTTYTNPAPGLPPSSTSHTCTDCTDKWDINLSKNPSPRNNYPYYKKDSTLPSPLNTPHRSLHNSH